MKRSIRISVCIIATALLAVGSSFSAAGEQPEFSSVKRHSTTMEFFGLDSADQLAKVLVGDGLENINPAPSAMASSGGSIFWEKIRDKVDDRGMRHVFYRQFYRPPIGAVSAASPVAAEGAWMAGAEIGLHYDSRGALVYVFGTQFEDVEGTSTPVIGTALDAVGVTDEVVADWTGISAAEMRERSPSRVDYQLSNATLRLHSTGFDNNFDYVWRVPAGGYTGLSLVAKIDAEAGDLVSLSDGIAWSECTPNSDDQDSARGIPQNQTLGMPDWRYVWATETDDRGASYTHEAHKEASSSNPDIQILMPMDGDGCDDEDYALMPVKTISGVVQYDNENYTSPDSIKGEIAGDALYFTYKTMKTFADEGRDGWDDDDGDAVVVFEADCGYWDGPYWRTVRDQGAMFYDGEEDFAPTPSVALCLRSAQTYSVAAAIDIVAHEWGHGVIFAENLWDRETTDGAIFHEGWADIIGHFVEWDNQPSGTTWERADWEFGEDRGSASRAADHDSTTDTYSLHKQDTIGVNSQPHSIGNRLATAYYLMAEGGKNPACERTPTPSWDGCDEDVDEIGANKAGRILFYALTDFATSSSSWNDFGNLAKTAAFFLYANCPTSNAQSEQRAAIDAFQAIGDSPSSFQIQCGP